MKIITGHWLWTGYKFHQFVINEGILNDVQYEQVPEPDGEKDSHLVVPEGVIRIAKNAFRWDDITVGVTLPDGLVAIDEHAFDLCDQMRSINIPATVTHIGEGAFYGCKKIKITVDKKNPRYKVIGKCLVDMEENKLIAIMSSNEPAIPEFITKFGTGFVCNESRLKKITIPAGVKALPKNTFNMCEKLVELILPESLETIGDGSFGGCDSMTIKAPADSYAIRYAKENNLNYEEI